MCRVKSQVELSGAARVALVGQRGGRRRHVSASPPARVTRPVADVAWTDDLHTRICHVSWGEQGDAKSRSSAGQSVAGTPEGEDGSARLAITQHSARVWRHELHLCVRTAS